MIKNLSLKYQFAGLFFLVFIGLQFFRAIPVSSSSDARELYVAFKICEGEADFLLPKRLDFPSSKPPLYHWLVCLSSKITNILNFPLLGRLVNLLAGFVICSSLWLLFGAKALIASLFMMSTYVFWDELISTKVDFVTCALIVSAVSFFVKKRYVLGGFVCILSVFGKSLFPLFFIAVLSLALISKFSQILVAGAFITAIATAWIIFTYVADLDFFNIWVIFEIFSRGLGDENINPSPWYFYGEKFLVNFFPLSILSIMAAFNFKKLNWEGKRLLLAAATVLTCFSFMEGKRTNYILPLLPFLAGALSVNFRILIEPLRVIINCRGFLFLFISLLIFLALLKPEFKSPLTILFVFTYDNLVVFVVSLIGFFSIPAKRPLFRAAYLFSCVWIILASYQNVLKHHRKFDLGIFNLLNKECSQTMVLKEHRNETFDVLIFHHKDKIKNNLDNLSSQFCILTDNPSRVSDKSCIALKKGEGFALFQCSKI